MTNTQIVQIAVIVVLVGLGVTIRTAVTNLSRTVDTLTETVRSFSTLVQSIMDKTQRIESNTEHHAQMDGVQHSAILDKMNGLATKMESLEKTVLEIRTKMEK